MVEFNKPGRDWQEVSGLIYNMFMAEHYALEEGSKIDAIYGIGNAAGRFWGGGFVTRNKFSIKIFTTPDGGTLVHFDKAMSGMSGGIMGKVKMNKEFDRVKLILQNL